MGKNCAERAYDWPGLPWATHVQDESPSKSVTFLNSDKSIVFGDTVVDEGDVDLDTNTPSNQETKTSPLPVTVEKIELLIDNECDEDVNNVHGSCTSETLLELELHPQTADVATVETDISEAERDYQEDIGGVNINDSEVQADVDLDGMTTEFGRHIAVPQTIDPGTVSQTVDSGAVIKRDTAQTEGLIKESRYDTVSSELQRALGSKVLPANIVFEPEDSEASLAKDSHGRLVSEASLQPEQHAASMKPTSYTTNVVAILGRVDEDAIASDIWQRTDTDSSADSMTPETRPVLEPLQVPHFVEETEDSSSSAESTVVKPLVQEDPATVNAKSDEDSILVNNKSILFDSTKEEPETERNVLNVEESVDTSTTRLIDANVLEAFFEITDDRATESNVISITPRDQSSGINSSTASNEKLPELFLSEARGIFKTPSIGILEDLSRGVPSLRQTNHRFAMKPLEMENPASSLHEMLHPESPDSKPNHYDPRDLTRVSKFAKAAWGHSIAFLIGVNGRYKNQQMVDVLSIVWTNRFWQ